MFSTFKFSGAWGLSGSTPPIRLVSAFVSHRYRSHFSPFLTPNRQATWDVIRLLSNSRAMAQMITVAMLLAAELNVSRGPGLTDRHVKTGHSEVAGYLLQVGTMNLKPTLSGLSFSFAFFRAEHET